jgi:hypothetical protein
MGMAENATEVLARLGPYNLGPVLGSGAFATVRSAMHIPTGEKVVSALRKTLITPGRHQVRTEIIDE